MKNKIVTILCALVCTVSSVSPVYAMDITAPTDNAEVPLVFSKDSYFTVTLPETISAEKNTKSVDFNYSIEGDISADEKVTVNLEDGNPDIEGYQLKLSDITGKTKDANISIDKTDFAYNEITSKVTESGSVSFNDLTAGRWSGTAKFVIGLENVGISNEPGLYDAGGNMLCALTVDDVEADYTSSSPIAASLGVDSSQVNRVIIPDGTTSIGSYAFKGCENLSNVVIPNSVITIDGSAFMGCSSLGSILIPNSITSIGSNTFKGCMFQKSNFVNNSSLDAEANNYWGATVYDSYQGGVYIRNNTVVGVNTSVSDVVIPEGVTSIGGYAFSKCSGLTSISIPNSVTTISKDAFSSCVLEKSNFVNNSSLDAEANNYWGAIVYDSYQGGVYIRNNTVIGVNSSVSDVVIPDGVTSIADSVFANKFGLKSIEIPSSVTSIPNNEFVLCSGKLVTNSTAVNSSVLSGSRFSEIVYGDNINVVNGLGNYTSVTNIVLSENVNTINPGTFSGCTNLTSVTFKDTEGWKVDSTALSSTDLADPSTAATYLKSTYTSGVWHK